MATSYLPERAYHAAHGLKPSELDVILVESDRAIRAMMHKMVMDIGVKKLRSPRSPEDAFWAMQQMPPNLLIIDQNTQPIDGLSLIKRMRDVSCGNLCFVPTILTVRRTTGALVDMAKAIGVNIVLIKPFSPRTLNTKLNQLAADSRCFVLKGDRYVIESAAAKRAS